MKRYDSLAPLSRDHHPALILARLLRKDAPAYKGLPTQVNEKAVYAMQFYQGELSSHFEKEENLLTKLMHVDWQVDILIKEIFEEHKILRNAFLVLADQPNQDEMNDQLGKLLEAHIRKEERILFPLLQEHFSEEDIKQFI
jgi:hemerythrin-like domain-containing protein